MNRNAFLLGCLDFTEEEGREHLIVGLGVQFRSTTKISAIGHVLGDATSVSIPTWVDRGIERHLRAAPRAEALLFHNHPRWWVNDLVDNTPIPSPADRDALVARAFKPAALLRRLYGNGGFRFYVGENGFVREFKTPSLRRILAMLEAARRIRR